MEPTELILLEGTVSAVIYRNEENGYTILRLESDQEEEDVAVVGTMPARGSPSRASGPTTAPTAPSLRPRSWSGGCPWGKRPS